MKEIEQFINDMKKSFPEELEHVFYRGYCYWFAVILSIRFKGEIWFNPVMIHFAAYIDGNLYDIYGEINKGFCPITGEYDIDAAQSWISWEEFQLNNNRDKIEAIVDSCIKKI